MAGKRTLQLLVLLVPVMLVTSCTKADIEEPGLAPSTTTVSTTTTTTTTAATLPAVELVTICDAGDRPEADPALYRDEPVYPDGEAIYMKVEPFARTMEGFRKLWWDPRHNGWIHVGFIGVDISEAQRQLDREFPDGGVVAVELPYSDAQLSRIAMELEPLLPAGMGVVGSNELHAKVWVWVGMLEAESVEALSRAVGDLPVCATGCYWYQCAEPGPQQASGEGWRYLAEVDAWIGFDPLVITDDTALARIWVELGLDPPEPHIDWEAEVVVAFELGHPPGDCYEQRFDGVRVDGDLLHAAIVSLGLLDNALDEDRSMCDLVYSPYVYIAAVERSVLPPPPFTIRTAPRFAAETVVDVDLRIPGASAPTELSIRPEI